MLACMICCDTYYAPEAADSPAPATAIMFLELASTSLNTAISDEGEVSIRLIVCRLRDYGLRLNLIFLRAFSAHKLRDENLP